MPELHVDILKSEDALIQLQQKGASSHGSARGKLAPCAYKARYSDSTADDGNDVTDTNRGIETHAALAGSLVLIFPFVLPDLRHV